ncbi:MAG: hypothetical protein ROO73_05760 [Roseivirga sp.]
MRFYLDTSVFGGFYDPEFSADTAQLFEEIVKSKIKVVYSYLTQKELEGAPPKVKKLLDRIPDECLESIDANKEAVKLAKNYVKEGALTDKFEDDAIHIALATVHRVDVLVSWNFKHMVSFFRIRQYNAVNLKYGYATIDIRSPKEILL